MSNQRTEEYWEQRFDQLMQTVGGNYDDPDKAESAVMRIIESEQTYE